MNASLQSYDSTENESKRPPELTASSPVAKGGHFLTDFSTGVRAAVVKVTVSFPTVLHARLVSGPDPTVNGMTKSEEHRDIQ